MNWYVKQKIYLTDSGQTLFLAGFHERNPYWTLSFNYATKFPNEFRARKAAEKLGGGAFPERKKKVISGSPMEKTMSSMQKDVNRIRNSANRLRLKLEENEIRIKQQRNLLQHLINTGRLTKEEHAQYVRNDHVKLHFGSELGIQIRNPLPEFTTPADFASRPLGDGDMEYPIQK